ncbi:mitochondrial inner membrane protease ATP23 homolog isoform X2 [Ooceraea biroi]|uniref:Mitochondrial inner membrane protease ATP23 n=1 Tax=Ooceraea biroi TaxID=2015173 RepID=A0A026WDV6_OOCBI|nr:mitochondrial inner membrane protease ATP23 homolog isoform X2 [Ooceraea biroi]EZA53866.1 Mitochondrial inner membrane protease ATP23-like protein [Ooceraea biroi]
MTTRNEKTNEGKREESDAAKAATSNGPSSDEFWGPDLYPERRGAKVERSWFNLLIGASGRESVDKARCEANVYKCIKNSPIVKLMLAALKSSGCEVDMRRHISCEVCNPIVSGGYDSEFNQVVICQNTVSSASIIQGVLLHELIHMFDFCRNKLDVKNIDHIACTEIRAANLAHCSFISSLIQGHSSFFNIKASHQNCVKNKAKLSIMNVHKVSDEVASAAIERVFTKCYNDLEPIGRRLRRNSEDMPRAYAEAFLYGYEA